MWLSNKKIVDSTIWKYQDLLLNSSPNHVVIDNLFDTSKLNELMQVLHDNRSWETQRHTYSALYVDNDNWQGAKDEHRFVQRDVWQGETHNRKANNIAHSFLSFLRGDEFLALLSRIFNVTLTDENVANPSVNTNYFRLGPADFVNQHADDSPGREVCMLLYLNKDWDANSGGDLVFMGKNGKRVSIAPLFNRCVLFDPSSEGAEHWVNAVNAVNENTASKYRYNITSWYWSE
ncbi:MAG: SM-20-related protein [Glaciecola sp.]|jgi:SM-20-related protein